MSRSRCLLFVCILALAACAPKSGISKIYTLDDPKAHFSIEYPNGWFIDDENRNTEGMYYVRFSPEAKNSSTALLISFEDKNKTTQTEFIQLTQNDLERLAKPCTSEKVTLDGALRLKLLCEGYTAVFFEGKKQYYVLSYPDSPYKQRFENMIQNFQAL